MKRKRGFQGPPRSQAPDIIQQRLPQALALLQRGRLSEIILEDILKQRPNHFDALHLLGVIACQTKNPHQGEELFGKAIKINPKVADAHNNRGNALKELRRLDEALASYDQAIALKHDYAEAYYNRGTALIELKHPGEALASYDKAIALKPDYAEAHNNRGNALKELKRLDEALTSYDKAIALKHDYIEVYYNRCTALIELKRPGEALASYDQAIALKPDYAEAHNNRGNALKELKRLDEALTSYDKAIALKPDYAEAHNNRGVALQDLNRPDEALASYDKAIALKPDFAEAHNNRGVALQDLNRPDQALASYDKAIALKSDYTEAHMNQSLCLLQTGRFEQGWRQHEWRKKLDNAFRSYPQPVWLGEENIAGKTLFIYSEQGLGDTIQFCRYVKLMEARGAIVIMSVQQPVRRLLKQISPTIQIIDPNETPTDFDYHCPLLSLPRAFVTTLETIPAEPRYLKADDELRAAWSARLPPKTNLRIGTVWSGSTGHKNDHNRSMKLETLLPIFSLDADWICLQKEVRDKDLALLRQDSRIAHFGDELKDFSDTAALVDFVDLVITVDTSVAHLAGAMGKPVWILLPFNPDWRRLLERNDSPWYPTARLFRQPQIGNWVEVINRVKDELRFVIG